MSLPTLGEVWAYFHPCSREISNRDNSTEKCRSRQTQIDVCLYLSLSFLLTIGGEIRLTSEPTAFGLILSPDAVEYSLEKPSFSINTHLIHMDSNQPTTSSSSHLNSNTVADAEARDDGFDFDTVWLHIGAYALENKRELKSFSL